MAANPPKVTFSAEALASAASLSVSSSSKDNDNKLDNKKTAETKATQESEKSIKTSSDKVSAPNLKSSEFSFDFTRLGSDVTKKLGDYQNNAQLATFCNIVRFSHDKCQSDLKDRKRVTEELLPHVFNANPEGIEKLFNIAPAKASVPTPATASAITTTSATALYPKLLLTKSSYREGYNSQKLKKQNLNDFICFRDWKDVSALQAAYLSGDGPFLGRKILAYLLRDNALSDKDKLPLLEKARQQLQELIDRIKVQPTAENAKVNTAKVVAANTNVSIAAAFTATTAVTATAASPASALANSNTGIPEKEKSEASSVSKNTENKFADSFEFLAPVKELIKAYNTYITQYNLFDSKGNLTENDWTVLDSLWEQVGECQKRLPRYVLQEFCGPTPFSSLTEFSFTTRPSRSECRDWNNKLLDLDAFGSGTSFALYKGGGVWGVCTHMWAAMAALDLEAINRLCELREADLRHTVNLLGNT